MPGLPGLLMRKFFLKESVQSAMKAVLRKEGPCPLWLAAPPDMALAKASRRGASDV